jgi:hypothetical protein
MTVSRLYGDDYRYGISRRGLCSWIYGPAESGRNVDAATWYRGGPRTCKCGVHDDAATAAQAQRGPEVPAE